MSNLVSGIVSGIIFGALAVAKMLPMQLPGNYTLLGPLRFYCQASSLGTKRSFSRMQRFYVLNNY